MKSKRSRLALVGMLALALTVTVGLVSGSVADAKKKKKKKPAFVTATVSASNVAVPDRGVGATAPFGQVDIPLTITGKKFKQKVVTAETVTVTIQATTDMAGGIDDLTFQLINPKGRKVFLEGGIGSSTTGPLTLGPLTITPDSDAELCEIPPCIDPEDTVLPPWSGTEGNSELALYTGTKMSGTWRVRVQDDTNTKSSVINNVTLNVTGGPAPVA